MKYGKNFGIYSQVLVSVIDKNSNKEKQYLIYEYIIGKEYFTDENMEFKCDMSKWNKLFKNKMLLDISKMNNFEISEKIFDYLLKEIKNGKTYYQNEKILKIIHRFGITAELSNNDIYNYKDEYLGLLNDYKQHTNNNNNNNNLSIKVIGKPKNHTKIKVVDWANKDADDLSLYKWEPSVFFNISRILEYNLKTCKSQKIYNFKDNALDYNSSRFQNIKLHLPPENNESKDE